MEAHLEVSTCHQCASEGHRCVFDTLDLAVDRRIKAVCFQLRHRHFGESFRSSPELNIDSPVYSRPDLRSLQSPVLKDGVNTVVVAAASTSTGFPDFPVTAETKADSLETQSSVYDGVQNTVPTELVEILARSEHRKSQSTCSESRCVVDTLNLAVDRRITGVGLPLRRSQDDSFRSSPELTLDSPMYSDLRSLQSPVLKDGVNTVVVAAASTSTGFPDFPVTADTKAVSLETQSSVYGAVQNTVSTAPVEILARSEPQKSKSTCSDSRCVVDTLDLAVDRRITGVGLPLRRSHGDGFRSSPELKLESPVYSELGSLQAPVLKDGVNTVVVAAASTSTGFPDFPVTADTKAVSLETQSSVYGGVQNTVPTEPVEILARSEHRKSQSTCSESRCVVDTLNLAVDRRITGVGLPLRRSHGDGFRSSPELKLESPVYSELGSLQAPVLKDGVNTVVVAAASTSTGFPDFPVTADTKAVSLETQSSVYGGVQNTVPTEPVEILARSEHRKSQSTCSESRCVVDTLNLAVDRRITGVGLPLRRSHGDGFRSSPELKLESPVYSELGSLQAPVLNDGVNTVQPEPAEMPQKPARSERRKSAFTRSRRFIWKGLVNAARRLCCCRTFVDME
ncbi:unnamed protein product [Macrosiphum euphorbiae]|uniref:Uncharacterized protein n=1 Tax=Macrosiphum euphorbiae TaxID=13131 RepID=A0AAV0X9A7_9HEMI|nr:unnamed protein product [Macrosiphum euphorbiae]